MGSRLVYDLAVALARAGFQVLRFDFRGVNRSEGVFANGIGETEDAAAAFDVLASRAGEAPVVVGYSFGAAVALRLAQVRPVARLVAIGLPLPVLDSALSPVDDAPRVPCPIDLVLGDEDPFVTGDAARALAATFARPAGVHVLPGAAHFLEPSHNARAAATVLSILDSPPGGA